jgi:hypothetical protein
MDACAASQGYGSRAVPVSVSAHGLMATSKREFIAPYNYGTLSPSQKL